MKSGSKCSNFVVCFTFQLLSSRLDSEHCKWFEKKHTFLNLYCSYHLQSCKILKKLTHILIFRNSFLELEYKNMCIWRPIKTKTLQWVHRTATWASLKQSEVLIKPFDWLRWFSTVNSAVLNGTAAPVWQIHGFWKGLLLKSWGFETLANGDTNLAVCASESQLHL